MAGTLVDGRTSPTTRPALPDTHDPPPAAVPPARAVPQLRDPGTDTGRPGVMPLWTRRARPDDLPQLVALVERCSFETLQRRFHGATGRPMERELQRIATPTPRHRSWVVTDGEAVRGTATLAWSSSGPPEVGVLVEDAWFRRGLGRALCAQIAAEASRAGVPLVVARIQGDNHRAARFVRALAPDAPRQLNAGELTVVVSLPAAAAGSG